MSTVTEVPAGSRDARDAAARLVAGDALDVARARGAEGLAGVPAPMELEDGEIVPLAFTLGIVVAFTLAEAGTGNLATVLVWVGTPVALLAVLIVLVLVVRFGVEAGSRCHRVTDEVARKRKLDICADSVGASQRRSEARRHSLRQPPFHSARGDGNELWRERIGRRMSHDVGERVD